MTKSLAFSPAISGKLVLLPAIPGKLSLLPAISGKLGFSPAIPGKLGLLPAISGKLGLLPAISDNKKLHPASVFSDRLLQCSFSFFVFYSVRILHPGRFHFRLSHPSQSQSQALTPKPITISGSHAQADHNLRFSHPSQSQFQALTSARRSTRPTVPSDHQYDKP